MIAVNRFNPGCLSEVSSLLDSFPTPVVLINTDYQILGTNRSYRHLFGEAEAATGKQCYAVSHHYARPCHQMGEECPMQACLASGEPQRVLHQHHSPEGEEHVDVELCPIRNGQGEITAFIEIIRPIKSERDEEGRHKLIGHSRAFTHTLELIGRVAPSESAVLLLGESGTGKELAAHAVHRASHRAGGPFVPVDCSGLTESLFESELFGHEKGAFTGAHSRKQGLVEAARGGTLFLDEIGDVPLNLQVKLLRLLETGTFRRVGSVEPQQAEFRLVCATHRDLQEMVEDGSFRRDLYYRISAFPITLPSLQQRVEDLPLLVDGLLQRLYPDRKMKVTEEALACLRAYRYPGNIRELRNIMERALLLANGDEINGNHLPEICAKEPAVPQAIAPQFGELLPLEEMEQHYLRWAVSNHLGDKRSLAKELGISERTLYRKLEKAQTEYD
jgi:transcriptional regulator with PAS, ATPase and Fis domain